MRQRESGGRRGPVRASRRTVLIFCGGARTEPDYFEGLKTTLADTAVNVKVRKLGIAPEGLVRAAADYRDSKPGTFDEVWCVVDVDQFDVTKAVALAKQLKVGIAVSNPCFEVWLLLHHAECRSHCTGYEDVAARLKKHLPAYDKTRLHFAHYADRVGDAVKRAKDLDPTGAAHALNPSTGVWPLVEQLMEQKS